MFTTTHQTEQAKRSSGRACASIGAFLVERTMTPFATTSNVSGVWYVASPVALRHDINKAGSPRGSS